MNCLLILKGETQNQRVARITGPRANEVLEWHNLKPGISIKAGVEGGKLGTATVVRLEPGLIELVLSLDSDPPDRLPLELIVAVSRPPTVRKVIQLAASAGVSMLHFVRSFQSEKSYLKSKALLTENVAQDLRRGVEQGCDTRLPEVQLHDSVDRMLPVLKAAPHRFLADLEGSCDSLVRSPISLYDTTQMAVGPESGWGEREKDSFVSAGFIPLGLGPRMYRVEFACALLIGQLLAVRQNGCMALRGKDGSL